MEATWKQPESVTAQGELTWRVKALWGPGIGSFSAGAGTDTHTVSFSAVRAAGDCKTRGVPEPCTRGQ